MSDVNYKVRLQDVSFHIVSVWRGPTGHIQLHAHSVISYELHYIESGRGILKLQSEEYLLEKGMFYLTGPGILHEQIAMPQEPMVELGMYYTVPNREGNPHLLTTDSLIGRLIQQKFWIGEGNQEIYDVLLRLYQESLGEEAGYQSIIPFLAGELLVYLGRLYAVEGEKGEKAGYIPSSEEFKYLQIEREFLHNYREVTLPKLASTLGLSIRQVQRLLKSHYGSTFQQKLQETKLNMAYRLLITTRLSITEIAEQSGFSSSDYFGYCFKEKYHISPSQFRKQHEV